MVMISPEQRIPVGSRVKLRDGVDPGFYGGYSRVGNQGWIKRRELDKFGYPRVLVQWDRDHWAYNGAEDCWTWEAHFDPVKEHMDDSEKKIHLQKAAQELTETFIKGVYGLAGLSDEQVEEAAKETDEPTADENDAWKESLLEALDALGDSQAFILLALKSVETSEGAPSLVTPVIVQNSRDEECTLVLQHQLAHLSLALYDSLIGHTISKHSEAAGESE